MEMKLMVIVLVVLIGLWARAECSSPVIVNGIFQFPRVNTTILNRLDSAEITVHCKSKNDDIGEKKLGASSMYQFNFRPNNILSKQTTLFFCTVATPFGSLQFDAYDQKRDMKRCRTKCDWEVIEEVGVIGYDQWDSKIDITIPWQKL